MRICTKCNESKSENNFNKCNFRKDGLYLWCKSCASIYRKKYHKQNKESLRQKRKIYRQKNKDRLNKKNKEWMRDNKERRSIQRKEYRSRPECKERKLISDRLYYRQNYKNPLFKLKRVLQNKLRKNVNKIKIDSYTRKTIDFLGCNLHDFKSYIESQFKDGMTWDNYGHNGWHIDHKLPVSYFDFNKDEDIAKCFHYTNLQPLWAKENILKRNKILDEYL